MKDLPAVEQQEQVWIEKSALQDLVLALRAQGYRTVLPCVREGAIVYAEAEGIADLPIGYLDAQDGGIYRLDKNDTEAHFDYVVGPHSLKNYVFVPRETVLAGERNDGQWQFSTPDPNPQPLAVIGVRACDLHALAIQDRVFLEGPYVDPAYQARRNALFLVAVNCRRAAATCFCHAMETGPALRGGYDLGLTELGERAGEGGFVVAIGSEAGRQIVSQIPTRACTDAELKLAEEAPRRLAEEMRQRDVAPADATPDQAEPPRQRQLDTDGIRDLLLGNLEHPQWADVAERCLACGNCTMVCPTCFCSSVEDTSDLTGDAVKRERVWASCFTAEHSYMSSGVVRATTQSRYRQWLVHKLATWIDQFDTSGCVGCGRCITWCPVAIDLTQEVAAIRGGTT